MDLGEFILKCLRERGPLTTMELSKALGVHQKAVNKSIGTLSKKNLVVGEVNEAQTPYGVYVSKNAPRKWRVLK